MIALTNAFQSIIQVCPGKIKKFHKKFKNPILDHSKIFFGKTGFFPGNPALSVFLVYYCLTSCQKSWNSNDGKYDNFDYGHTDLHFQVVALLK